MTDATADAAQALDRALGELLVERGKLERPALERARRIGATSGDSLDHPGVNSMSRAPRALAFLLARTSHTKKKMMPPK